MMKTMMVRAKHSVKKSVKPCRWMLDSCVGGHASWHGKQTLYWVVSSYMGCDFVNPFMTFELCHW